MRARLAFRAGFVSFISFKGGSSRRQSPAVAEGRGGEEGRREEKKGGGRSHVANAQGRTQSQKTHRQIHRENCIPYHHFTVSLSQAFYTVQYATVLCLFVL